MNKFTLFYGPKSGFDSLLKKNGVNKDNSENFSRLIFKDDELRREHRHYADGQESDRSDKDPIPVENLVAGSDDYATVREHVISNFEVFLARFEIDRVFLHNPPRLLADKVRISYRGIRTITHAYSPLTEDSI